MMLIIKFIVLCIALCSLGLYINMKISSVVSFILFKIDEPKKDTIYSICTLLTFCVFFSMFLTFF